MAVINYANAALPFVVTAYIHSLMSFNWTATVAPVIKIERSSQVFFPLLFFLQQVCNALQCKSALCILMGHISFETTSPLSAC